jgi:hypothetical protein
MTFLNKFSARARKLQKKECGILIGQSSVADTLRACLPSWPAIAHSMKQAFANIFHVNVRISYLLNEAWGAESQSEAVGEVILLR